MDEMERKESNARKMNWCCPRILEDFFYFREHEERKFCS